jgi:predicted RND superfamily exporter protein
MRERLFGWILDHRGVVLLLSLLLSLVAGSGIQFLHFSSDFRIFFNPDNPQLQAFDALQNTFTKSDNILFVLAPKDGNVFSRETLAAVEELTQEAWKIPYSLRVDSITNYQHTYADGDDMMVEDLVKDAATLSDAELAQKRQVALDEPLLRDRLISPDGAVTGINIMIQVPGKSTSETPEAARYAWALNDRMAEKYPDIGFYLTGMAIMNYAFAEAGQQDVIHLYPFMFAVVLGVLAILIRSIPGTIGTLAVIILMIVGTMGLAGWMGIQMSPTTTGVPIIILTLAIADCVHLLVNFLHLMREGYERRAAMIESLRINLQPIFLTSLTTAIGFLSLNLGEVPPFHDLGNMSAIGVFIAFALSITFLPALMMVLPIRTTHTGEENGKRMAWIADFVIRRRKLLLWLMPAMALFLIAQVPRNELDDQYVKYFDPAIRFRADTDFAVSHLTGIYMVEYALDSGEPGGISDPKFLQRVAAFAEWYRQQPFVLHVNTFTDVMKRLNQNMHGDDPAWYRLPEDRKLAAQYLLLYEMSLPFGLDLNSQININKSKLRFTVSLKPLTTNEFLVLEARATEWLQQNTPPPMHVQAVSPAVMFAYIGYRNIRAMLKGSVLALLMISGVLVIALRSVRIGLLSMIPNLIPMSMAFGVWGMYNGRVGLALSVVTGVTLGIVVDDTIHFLSKYLRARREQGKSPQEAVRYAFITVGNALWATSFVLVLGFLVLTLSDFRMNADMGLLTAVTIALALLADFLLLPPLLMQFGGRGDEKSTAADPV